jgi:hypothetical protein
MTDWVTGVDIVVKMGEQGQHLIIKMIVIKIIWIIIL